MLSDKRDETKSQARIKLNSRDVSKEARAICITRLKNFPAEKIKKVDDPPTSSPEKIDISMVQRDPREVSLASSSVRINCDRGDATSSELTHQQFKPSRTSAMNQQQVAPNNQKTDQTSSQSDNMQTRRTAHFEKQTARNPSTTSSQQMIVQPSPTRGTKRTFESSSCAVTEQNCDEAVEYEEQPVGGRNAANYKQKIMLMQQQQQDTNNCQSAHLQGEVLSYYQLPENRQPICPQLHRNAYNQNMTQVTSHVPKQQHIYSNLATQSSVKDYRLATSQLALTQGMTSPQDMIMSQMRLTQHNIPVYQQNVGCPLEQNAWPMNGTCADYNQQHTYQQHIPPAQWGCYYQNVQDTNFSQQNSKDPDQRVLSQGQINCKAIADQQAIKEAHGQQDNNKRTLQFTPDMIRDQELLVSVMRQQGVSHDVMRRQFDALLNEQRRHLAYIAQFQQQTDAPEKKRTCQLVRRKTENEEKPEWMVHITPPRISYRDLEKIKLQQRTRSEQHPKNNQSPQEVSRAASAQLHQQDYRPKQPREETIAPVALPQRMYLQMSPHQWQQQATEWPRRGDHQAMCGLMGCYPCSLQQSAPNGFYHQPSFNQSQQSQPRFDQSQQSSCQYPYNAPHHTTNPMHSYQAQPDHQKVWSEEHNATSPIGRRETAMDVACERNEKSTESSSLLKMRMYKEVIRPQKRNNGLQDPETAQRALEKLKDLTSKKGLEYLANLAKKKTAIKLNGTQETGEVPEDLRPVSLESRALKRILANGLENTRNLNNPAPRVSRPSRPDDPAAIEYPRQRQNSKTYYGAPAEVMANVIAAGGSQQRDHAAVVSHVPDAGSVPDHQANLARAHLANNAVILPYGGAPDYQQMQGCCHSRQRPANHNGGQGDGIASMQRSNAPDTTGIDRAGGDVLGENSSAEGATKRRSDEQSMLRTWSYGRPETRDVRTIDCAAAHLPVKKPDYAPNNPTSSPDKLLASKLAQLPMIF